MFCEFNKRRDYFQLGWEKGTRKDFFEGVVFMCVLKQNLALVKNINLITENIVLVI